MLPIEWLTLGLSYSYTDAKYRSYLVPNAPPAAPTDNSGHTIPFTPRNAANFRAETHFGVPGDAGTIRIGADVTYRSAIQFNDANSTPDFILAKSAYHGVLNMHATWSSSHDRSEVTVWAKTYRQAGDHQQCRSIQFLRHRRGIQQGWLRVDRELERSEDGGDQPDETLLT